MTTPLIITSPDTHVHIHADDAVYAAAVAAGIITAPIAAGFHPTVTAEAWAAHIAAQNAPPAPAEDAGEEDAGEEEAAPPAQPDPAPAA